MTYSSELEIYKQDFDCELRGVISKSKEFQAQFPDLDVLENKRSEKVKKALDSFVQYHIGIFDKLKIEIELEMALNTLNERCKNEIEERLHPIEDYEYWEEDDLISVCSNNDLKNLLKIIEKISLNELIIIEKEA